MTPLDVQTRNEGKKTESPRTSHPVWRVGASSPRRRVVLEKYGLRGNFILSAAYAAPLAASAKSASIASAI